MADRFREVSKVSKTASTTSRDRARWNRICNNKPISGSWMRCESTKGLCPLNPDKGPALCKPCLFKVGSRTEVLVGECEGRGPSHHPKGDRDQLSKPRNWLGFRPFRHAQPPDRIKPRRTRSCRTHSQRAAPRAFGSQQSSKRTSTHDRVAARLTVSTDRPEIHRCSLRSANRPVQSWRAAGSEVGPTAVKT